MSQDSKIYKILLEDQWETMQRTGSLIGAPIDLEDGYIHLSTLGQLAETLSLHFAGQTPLVVLEFSVELLQAGLRWEPSRKGQLFPHFYGQLSMDEVQRFWIIAWEGERHRLPESLVSAT